MRSLDQARKYHQGDHARCFRREERHAPHRSRSEAQPYSTGRLDRILSVERSEAIAVTGLCGHKAMNA